MSGGNFPNLGRFSTDFSKGWKILILGFFLAAAARAENLHPILGTNEQTHLADALRAMRMTEVDLGFEKDYGKPKLVLPRARKLLAEPLGLPVMGDEILAAASSHHPAEIWRETAELLDTKGLAPVSPPEGRLTDRGNLTNALSAFSAAADRAEVLLSKAVGGLTDAEKRYVTAAFLAGTFNAEDKPAVRSDLLSVGLTSQEVQRAISESLEIDPEPSSTNFLAIVQKMDFATLLEAGRVFQQAVYSLRESVEDVTRWPSTPTRIQGVWVGSIGDDVYTHAERLILDPGGNDVYSGDAGSANGLLERALAAVVDLGGDDRYVGDSVMGPGAALFGVSVLLDDAGDDLYRAEYLGQASAFFGVGWLEDRAGG